jgi:hypothetical protein
LFTVVAFRWHRSSTGWAGYNPLAVVVRLVKETSSPSPFAMKVHETHFSSALQAAQHASAVFTCVDARWWCTMQSWGGGNEVGRGRRFQRQSLRN